MKINFKYVPRKFFGKERIKDWIFSFKKYRFVRGFSFRLFGIHLNIKENKAREKLIKQLKTKERN